MINILSTPGNRIYERLISYAVENCNEFILVVRHGVKLKKEGKMILQELNPFLKEAVTSNEWPGTTGPLAVVYHFVLNEITKDILLKYSNNLYSWLSPNLPEDLCFFKGRCTRMVM